MGDSPMSSVRRVGVTCLRCSTGARVRGAQGGHERHMIPLRGRMGNGGFPNVVGQARWGDMLALLPDVLALLPDVLDWATSGRELLPLAHLLTT